MCFDIRSKHLDCCWGQTTSRIQNKEVFATTYLQASAYQRARAAEWRHAFDGPVAQTMTWAVRPMLCMRLNILTQYPWRPFQASSDSTLDLNRAPYCYALYGVEYRPRIPCTPVQVGTSLTHTLTWIVRPTVMLCMVLNIDPVSLAPLFRWATRWLTPWLESCTLLLCIVWGWILLETSILQMTQYPLRPFQAI